VRPEAKGIGYQKFLGVPSPGAGRAEEPKANPEGEETETEQGFGLWIKALILLCVTVWAWLVAEWLCRLVARSFSH